MSDREQIRVEAVERIARGEFAFEARPLTPAPGEWDSLPSPVQDRYRRRAAVLVDALGDLLPTGERWGLLAPDAPFPDRVTPLDDETEARGYLHDAPGRKLMRRYRHDWIEVTE